MEHVDALAESQADPIMQDYEEVTGKDDRKKGLSLWLASIFIIGEMAGSGVLALPKALADTGWYGIILLVFCCIVCLYAGVCLGRCWSILEERYEEYRDKNRYPYPAIAQRAYGMKMRYFVSFTIDINLFGVATVFLLLSSQLIADVASKLNLSFCYWVLIFAVVLCPLMWLGTPNDFWPAAVLALSTTFTACVIIIVLLAQQVTPSLNVNYPPPSWESYFLSYGTMLFAFGGAASFPTFQNDMKDKSQFPKAATIGFIALFFLYLPVLILGYYVYGGDTKPNVMESLPYSISKMAVEVLLAFHMVFAFLLVVNAAVQDVEEFLKVPKHFSWKRCVTRTLVLGAAVFVAETIPRFGKVLNLVGGSATCLTSIIFPCLFYYKLCSQRDPTWIERSIPVFEKVVLILIIVSGIIGGIISTYTAFVDILKPDSFCPPCYVNITAASQL